MKVLPSKPLTYRGGNRAVLLLHGFTGNTLDVRLLGKYLQERGFTCHAPLYQGHGLGPEPLVETGPRDWWNSVLEGYHFLEKEGFKEIAVAGVSLGGLFSLKVGSELPVKAIVPMSAPILAKKEEDLYQRVLDYARGYKKLEGKDEEQIQLELDEFMKIPMPSLKDLKSLISGMGDKIPAISSPILVIQGRLDEPMYLESAERIYEAVGSERKEIKWYDRSGHIITLGKEREEVNEEIYQFLDSLDW